MTIFVLIESINVVDFIISENDSIESLTNTDFLINCFISDISLFCVFDKVSILPISLLFISVQLELSSSN